MADDTAVAVTAARVNELDRRLDQIEDRVLRAEERLGHLEGRESERIERHRRTAELKVVQTSKYNYQLAAKIIAGAVTVALAIVGAVKC